LKKKLISIVEKINFKEVILDIENFVEDKNILEFIENNGKEWTLDEVRKI
jgi:hypothetical protein